MRISRTGRILVGIAILITIALAWVVSSWPPPRNHRLPDGTVLRVERVSFGPRDPAYAPPVNLFEDWKGTLAAMLPKKWAGAIPVKKFVSSGNWWMSATVHSNVHSLNVWITRRDLTNGFAPVQADVAELVDDQGCVYPATQRGGVSYVRGGLRTSSWPIQSLLTWFTFEAYPRHQSKIRLRLYNQNYSGTNQSRELVAEFVVLNPAPRASTATGWTLEPLPEEKKFGDVSFILRSVGYKTNWIEGASNSLSWNYSANPVEIVPRFAVLEHGRQTAQWQPADVNPDPLEPESLLEQPSDWDALEMELSDSSGNIAPRLWGHSTSFFLSPREPAWKLAVKFFGSEQSEAASNTVWIIRGVKVPGPQEYSSIWNEKELDGVSLTTIALTGPGETTYHGDTLARMSNNVSSRGNSMQIYKIGSEEIVDTVTPHVAVRLGNLGDDQRLTIRAVDADGNDYYATSFGNGDNTRRARRPAYLQKDPGPYQLSCFLLDLPSGVKKVDLHFCVHRARTVDFFFKPPPQ
jgi:hypothetical protein